MDYQQIRLNLRADLPPPLSALPLPSHVPFPILAYNPLLGAGEWSDEIRPTLILIADTAVLDAANVCMVTWPPPPG